MRAFIVIATITEINIGRACRCTAGSVVDTKLEPLCVTGFNRIEFAVLSNVATSPRVKGIRTVAKVLVGAVRILETRNTRAPVEARMVIVVAGFVFLGTPVNGW
jgi:hypothetical protein